ALVSAPGGKYKVFIVDEVHMLTKDAFNALLKVLEEPPSGVVFILATTEPHKILATVLSRVQRFDFKRLTPSQILGKLKQMSKAEHVMIASEGLNAIAVSSDGALRDAEVALSKVFASNDNKKEISSDDVYATLGLIPANYYSEFLGYLALNDKNRAIDFVSRIYSGGIDTEQFTTGFVEYLRKILIHTINPAVLVSVGEELPDNDIKLISAYSGSLTQQQLIRMLNAIVLAKEGMKSSPISRLPLELAILELTA
ncbi:MAG: AAA family ATPase, partial [Candidatus Yanofskybacteria bacterium]|nr:AAA family ATPase [Candidatus Yanofskybacteria bacterium]